MKMFEISELGKSYQQELILDFAIDEKGNHPTITVEINNDIRKKEARLSSQLGRLVFGIGNDGERQEAAWINEKLEYCQKVARICVIDSKGLFYDGKKPASHTIDYFIDALIQSKTFRDWFADAITEIFNEDKTTIKRKTELISQD